MKVTVYTKHFPFERFNGFLLWFSEHFVDDNINFLLVSTNRFSLEPRASIDEPRGIQCGTKGNHENVQ